MTHVEKVALGDQVMKGNIVRNKGSVSVNWTPAQVVFSQGTPTLDPKEHEPATMIFISCDNGTELHFTEDQLIMLNKGLMKLASTIAPGDELMGADGNAITVRSVRKGEWFGPVHHISISDSYTGEINDHLLNANGVVIGDFVLQLNYAALEDLIEKAQAIGSPAYYAKYKKLYMGQNRYSL